MAGRAEPIRLAFHIGGIQFEDNRISMEEFSKQKNEGAFKFGQIPVLEIDGIQYAQSHAILRYVGRLTNLYPQEDPIQCLKVDQALYSIDEIVTRIIPTYFIKDKEEQLQARKKLSENEFSFWLEKLESQLKDGNGYFAGNQQISIAELYMVQVVDWLTRGSLEGVPSDIAKKYGFLQKSIEFVKNIDKVKEYYARLEEEKKQKE
ncbi:Thioredoxin-like fold [Pseudocohnilembus persalinus]|uniref:Thioredoxin-like fold n=1 Tax=Pseudocohnilembus persalinus TaxID=266149 RepID=A0A0V0QYT9_PSEPJ|nr:Thioredoxin-like fold [Pseudocohnilembus persalinus]|eukprot:KRX07459.1 Thioredoxin-like fold [Pseudocohnilembus persalinus]